MHALFGFRLLQKDALNLEATRMEALHFLCREGKMREVSLVGCRQLSRIQPLLGVRSHIHNMLSVFLLVYCVHIVLKPYQDVQIFLDGILPSAQIQLKLFTFCRIFKDIQ